MEYVLKSIQAPNFRSFTAPNDKFYRNKVSCDLNENQIRPSLQSERTYIASPPKVCEISIHNKVSKIKKDSMM